MDDSHLDNDIEHRSFWEEAERPFVPPNWENIEVCVFGTPIHGITLVEYKDGKEIVTTGLSADDPRLAVHIVGGNPPQPHP